MATALASGLLGATIALSAFGALAQPPADVGWYAGGALGQAQVNLDCAGTTACDDKDSSWKVFAGSQFSRNFAVELGSGDLGQATASTPPVGLFRRQRGVKRPLGSLSQSVCCRSPTGSRFREARPVSRRHRHPHHFLAGSVTTRQQPDSPGIGVRLTLPRLGVRLGGSATRRRGRGFRGIDIDVMTLGLLGGSSCSGRIWPI
jgi:hypothetical protein